MPPEGHPQLNQRRRERSHMAGRVPGQQNPQFKPQPTTVHNVELIQGYFSSGEDELYSHPLSLKNRRKSPSKTGYGHPAGHSLVSGGMHQGQPDFYHSSAYLAHDPSYGSYMVDRQGRYLHSSVKKVYQHHRTPMDGQMPYSYAGGGM